MLLYDLQTKGEFNMKEYFYLKDNNYKKINISDINALAFFALSMDKKSTVGAYVKSLKSFIEKDAKSKYLTKVYSDVFSDKKAILLLKDIITLALFEKELNQGNVTQENISTYHNAISEYNTILASNEKSYYRNVKKVKQKL